MKRKTVYVCSICESEYTTAKTAEDCEKQHRKPVKIIAFAYRKENRGKGYSYPDKLRIKFSDNSDEEYSLSQPDDNDPFQFT